MGDWQQMRSTIVTDRMWRDLPSDLRKDVLRCSGLYRDQLVYRRVSDVWAALMRSTAPDAREVGDRWVESVC